MPEKTIAAGTVHDFESAPVRVLHAEGLNIAVIKLDDGFYAVENSCSHQTATLADGEIDDDAIECPRHGARFDIRTGAVRSLPAVRPVKTFKTIVENGEVKVCI